MITAVVDTNVLASGALATGSAAAAVIDAAMVGQFQLVLSAPILDELWRTLGDHYFARRLSPSARTRYVSRLEAVALLTPITATVTGVATHSEDDLILATALSAPTTYLVTGDKHLQHLQQYQGITLLAPTQFIALLPGRQVA